MSKNDCDKFYHSSINNIMLPSLIIIHKSTCNVQITFYPSTSVGGKRLVCFVARCNLTIHVTYFHPLILSLFLETSCSWDAHIYTYTYTNTYTCTYTYTCGGCSKFFLLETAILSQKKYFSQTFAISTKKLSRGPMLHCIWEFLLGNRSLTREICVSERPSKLILWRLRIHVWRFAFIGGPCSPSPASSDTPTPKLRADLLPASLETRHNKSTG